MEVTITLEVIIIIVIDPLRDASCDSSTSRGGDMRSCALRRMDGCASPTAAVAHAPLYSIASAIIAIVIMAVEPTAAAPAAAAGTGAVSAAGGAAAAERPLLTKAAAAVGEVIGRLHHHHHAATVSTASWLWVAPSRSDGRQGIDEGRSGGPALTMTLTKTVNMLGAIHMRRRRRGRWQWH